MTTEEHLKKIVVKCRELLEEKAAKRTPGKWTFGVRYIFAHDTCDEVAKCPFVEQGERDSWMTNASFIAACAGSAEAGWRATIAAISWIKTAYISAYAPEREEAERVSSEIIAAWPEELL